MKPINRGGMDLEFLTRKEFRRSFLSCWDDLTEKHRRATARSWRFFWKMTIRHKVRDILFCYVHHALPDRVILHRLLPHIFDSDCARSADKLKPKIIYYFAAQKSNVLGPLLRLSIPGASAQPDRLRTSYQSVFHVTV